VTCKPKLHPSFTRAVKDLKRTYRNAGDDLGEAIEFLLEHPRSAPVIPKDFGARKLRVRSHDMQTGKSGGFRLIYKWQSPIVHVLFAYPKPRQSSISSQVLKELCSEAGLI